jgi:predicted metal-binding membrane protein
VVERKPDGAGVGSPVSVSAEGLASEIVLPSPGRDTPRTAYRVLERRATVATVAVLLALSGVAWWSTVNRAGNMDSMVQGLAQVGDAMPFDMSIPVFMAMWATMMVAMMLPTVAPIVLLHRMVLRRRGQGTLSTAVFGSGYLVVWVAVGVAPLVILLAFRQVAAGSGWVDRVGGVVLVTAGVYQFTSWKETCLRACRSPLTFLATHDFGRGRWGAFRAGLSHGLYCLGCCWALMAVLFVVGLMNLTWMAVIAAVFLAEKNWEHGRRLTVVVGTAVLLAGLAVVIHPAFLDSVAGGATSQPTDMNQPSDMKMNG